MDESRGANSLGVSRRTFARRIAVLVVHREKFTRCSDHFLADGFQASLDQRARCSSVSAAAEHFRELVHVDIASAAERDLHLVVTEIAEEQRQSRSTNRSRVLRDSLEVFRLESILLGSARRN